MMMRYLGLGIGHLNSPDFPHEAKEIFVTEEDQQLPDGEDRQLRHIDTDSDAGSEAEVDPSLEDDEEDKDAAEEEVDMYDL
jgi:hypothetical protein